MFIGLSSSKSQIDSSSSIIHTHVTVIRMLHMHREGAVE
jgi:hypothetical protein